MLDLVQDNTGPTLIPVEFSEINVGAKFTTDRWRREKVDQQNAIAHPERMGHSSDTRGSIFISDRGPGCG